MYRCFFDDGNDTCWHCSAMQTVLRVTTLLGAFALGCSSSSTNSDGSGGASMGAGGSQPGTGANTGGAAATGGNAATGGIAQTGGAAAGSGGESTGGASVAAGGKATGGSTSPGTGGKATGGKSAAGGTASTGGRATGGESAAAGGSSSGGKATGGTSTNSATSTGGQATGGKSSAGGTTSAGGKAAGGTSSVGGGSSSGGQATGGGSSTSTGKSAGCGKTPTISSSQYNKGNAISITAAGQQRRYVLQVPTNYDNTHAYRLVVVYHQRDGNDKQMFNWQYYGLLPLSNDTTIFVAPNGQKNGAPCTGTGDGDSGCGWPNTNDSDLALADAVVAQIEDNFCIDTDRIFATGWSYGGSMSYRTACSRPLGGTAAWGVRGIAIYAAAQLSGNCTPNKPVAYYHAHGTHDSVLNYDSMGLPLAQSFATANGCTWATPTKVNSGTHVCTNLTGCKAGYPLEFCSFNGDHTPFPDNGQSQGSWGPPEAWKFLSAL